ncbi:hypothetical protein [Formosa sp. S-31]|uniref:hypothetical protein n=1 Tax=Formosa sp. S-31 TaxID=2790949 RepID=UPI003EB6AD6A
MKKLLFTIAFTTLAFAVQAQEISQHALGLRLGDSDGLGFEISYQHALGSKNRLEADLGWRNGHNYDGFQLTGIYQWVWPIENRFNWYAGVGGGLGNRDFNHHNDNDDHDDDGVYVFIAGDVGIEYNFEIPLLISLDFRPGIGSNHYDGYDVALGLRYQF